MVNAKGTPVIVVCNFQVITKEGEFYCDLTDWRLCAQESCILMRILELSKKESEYDNLAKRPRPLP